MPEINTGYCKSNDGLVHLVSAVNREYTLCGDAFDGDADGSEHDPAAWHYVKRQPITCHQCANEIENCRGVRIKRHNDRTLRPAK